MRTSKPIPVTLGPQRASLEARLKSGEYASASEVMRSALRALDRQDAALDEYLAAKVQASVQDPRPSVAERRFQAPADSSRQKREGSQAWHLRSYSDRRRRPIWSAFTSTSQNVPATELQAAISTVSRRHAWLSPPFPNVGPVATIFFRSAYRRIQAARDDRVPCPEDRGRDRHNRICRTSFRRRCLNTPVRTKELRSVSSQRKAASRRVTATAAAISACRWTGP
ncbi:putative addiction module CopG family antidote [Bradyrhizobium yuanmingense]